MDLGPSTSYHRKYFLKILFMTISRSSFVTKWFMKQKIYLKWTLPCFLVVILMSQLSKLIEGLKSDSHLPKKLFYLLQWKLFKNDFYLILKVVFINFGLAFWSFRKNGSEIKNLIRKTRLIPKFMMSQPG